MDASQPAAPSTAVLRAPVPGAGFADPVIDAQRVFRAVLGAMAEPGVPVPLDPGAGVDPPAPLGRGAAAVLLTLADRDTPVWRDPAAGDDVRNYLRFHAGIPSDAAPADAVFAFVADGRQPPPLDRFALGTAEQPDRSTTLIIQTDGLGHGPARDLEGPGIQGRIGLRLDGLADAVWQRLAAQRPAFPLGVDVLVVAGGSVIGLPRSIHLVG